MQKLKKLDISSFLSILKVIKDDPKWTAELDHRCIHLFHSGSENIFSPLTAVYYELTGKEIHRGSFYCEELTNEFEFPWWEILEISYASIANDCGKRYDRRLRNDMLIILGFPESTLSKVYY